MWEEKLDVVHDKRRKRTALGTSWGDAIKTLGVSPQTARLEHEEYPHEVLFITDQIPVGRGRVLWPLDQTASGCLQLGAHEGNRI